MTELARLVEHASRDDPEGVADPKHIRYNTGIYPTEDVIIIVKDYELLEHRARLCERRLRPVILGMSRAWDYSMTAISSIRGGMVDKLTAQVSRAEYTMKSNSQRENGMLQRMMRGDED